MLIDLGNPDTLVSAVMIATFATLVANVLIKKFEAKFSFVSKSYRQKKDKSNKEHESHIRLISQNQDEYITTCFEELRCRNLAILYTCIAVLLFLISIYYFKENTPSKGKNMIVNGAFIIIFCLGAAEYWQAMKLRKIILEATKKRRNS